MTRRSWPCASGVLVCLIAAGCGREPAVDAPTADAPEAVAPEALQVPVDTVTPVDSQVLATPQAAPRAQAPPRPRPFRAPRAERGPPDAFAVLAEAPSTYPYDELRRLISEDEHVAALELMESVLADSQSSPETPDHLLLLGLLKMQWPYWSLDDPYATSRPDEYEKDLYNDFVAYNGFHFRELIDRFPDSDRADDAAYVLTLSELGVECEGEVLCDLLNAYRPNSRFLRRYPTSEYAANAVARINQSFAEPTRWIDDFNEPGPYYSPTDIKALLASYDSIATTLADEARVRAYDVIAYIWGRFSNYARAAELYGSIIEDAPTYAEERDIPERLAALPLRSLRLASAEVISYGRVHLTWDAIVAVTPETHTVYRALGDSEEGAVLAELPGDVLAYTDTSAAPETDYRYWLVARTPEDTIRSNVETARTPARQFAARALVFNQGDRHLYVFGFLETGSEEGPTPEVVRVSEDGTSIERLPDTFFGLEEYAAPWEHARDRFARHVWFVDPFQNRVLHFDKGDPGFEAQLRAATDDSLAVELFDFEGEPYYGLGLSPYLGVRVTVDPAMERMRIGLNEGGLALAWDSDPDKYWSAAWGRLSRRSHDGAFFKEPSSWDRDAGVEVLAPDARDSSVWVYQGDRQTVTNIGPLARVRREVRVVTPEGAPAPRSLVFDVPREWAWYVDRDNLVKVSLRTGEILLTKTLAPARGSASFELAVDSQTGHVWMYDGRWASKRDTDGGLLLRVLLD